MNRAASISLIFILIISTLPTAWAEVDPKTYILREATPKIVEHAIAAIDPIFKESQNGQGYLFKSNGYTVVLIRGTTLIQLRVYFTGKKVTLTRINEWNRTKNFSRAYLDSEGNAAALESEIELKDGVTLATLGNFFATFIVSIEDFANSIR
jgi:hypothetical protein